MTSVDLTRSGDCTCCGTPVSLHFDGANRFLSCATARSRFHQQQFQSCATSPQDGERVHEVGLRTHESIFERRLGVWGV